LVIKGEETLFQLHLNLLNPENAKIEGGILADMI